MSNVAKIAEIAVFLPLDYSLHYSVPEVLSTRIKAGQRVIVPVGKRNLIGGLVLSTFSVIPRDLEIDPARLRPITALIDEVPILPEKMVPFIRWLSSYYFYPIGETVNTILPYGLRVVTSIKLTVTEEGLKALNQGVLSEVEENVVKAILDLSNPTISRVVKNLAIPDCFRFITRLRQKGMLTTLESLREERRYKKTAKFVIAVDKDFPAPRKKSEKLEKLWSLLQQNPEGILLAELEKQVPGAYYWVKKLKKTGIVRVEERELSYDLFENDVSVERGASITPTKAQEEIINAISSYVSKKSYQVFLLHGVTGSGKTEVYNNLIDLALRYDLQAMVIVPEIALSTHLERVLYERFGHIVAVLHSGLTPRERFDQWRGILEGKYKIVVGARSGVFAPLNNLGLIIVDEEQDSSLKQDSGLRYHGRDTAIMRAKLENIPVVLGSATPSLDSYHNALTGKYKLLELPERIHKRSLPHVEVVDMRREGKKTTIFSGKLLDEITKALNKNDQILLFLNRRGFATFLICLVCGEVIKCERCAISLTYHKRTNDLRCHYCGFVRPVVSECPKCGNPTIKLYGFGTEKIEEEYKKLFPGTRTRRLDSDAVRSRRLYARIFKAVRERKIDVLIGTQMLAKGHDFPGITLVGVVSADTTLQLPDFRASEITFQLLTQVAGRAGRGEYPGKVLIQTYNPHHYVFHYTQSHDYKGFATEELKLRKQLNYPPFTRLIRFLVTGPSEKKVKKVAMIIAGKCVELIKESPEFADVNVLGPAEAPLYLVKKQFRYHLFVRAPSARKVQNFSHRLVSSFSRGRDTRGVKIIVDVDPINVM